MKSLYISHGSEYADLEAIENFTQHNDPSDLTVLLFDDFCGEASNLKKRGITVIKVNHHCSNAVGIFDINRTTRKYALRKVSRFLVDLISTLRRVSNSTGTEELVFLFNETAKVNHPLTDGGCTRAGLVRYYSVQETAHTDDSVTRFPSILNGSLISLGSKVLKKISANIPATVGKLPCMIKCSSLVDYIFYLASLETATPPAFSDTIEYLDLDSKDPFPYSVTFEDRAMVCDLSRVLTTPYRYISKNAKHMSKHLVPDAECKVGLVVSNMDQAALVTCMTRKYMAYAAATGILMKGVRFKVYYISAEGRHHTREHMKVNVCTSGLNRIASKCKYICFLAKGCLPNLGLFTDPTWMRVEYVFPSTAERGYSDLLESMSRFVKLLVRIDITSPGIGRDAPRSLSEAMCVKESSFESGLQERSHDDDDRCCGDCANAPPPPLELRSAPTLRSESATQACMRSLKPARASEDLREASVLDILERKTEREARTCTINYTVVATESPNKSAEEGHRAAPRVCLRSQELSTKHFRRNSSTRIPVTPRMNRFIVCKKNTSLNPDQILCMVDVKTNEPVVSAQRPWEVRSSTGSCHSSFVSARGSARDSTTSSESLASRPGLGCRDSCMEPMNLKSLSNPCGEPSVVATSSKNLKLGRSASLRPREHCRYSTASLRRKPSNRKIADIVVKQTTTTERALLDICARKADINHPVGSFWSVRGSRVTEFLALMEHKGLVKYCGVEDISAGMLSLTHGLEGAIECLKAYLHFTNRRDGNTAIPAGSVNESVGENHHLTMQNLFAQGLSNSSAFVNAHAITYELGYHLLLENFSMFQLQQSTTV